MKTITKYIIILNILFVICSCVNKKEHKQSESFTQFISLFKTQELPLDFDRDNAVLLNPLEDKNILNKYLLINKNESYTIPVHVGSICKLMDNNKKIYSIVYIIIFGNGNTQLILANFSKETESMISQIVVYGDDDKTYQLSSIIDKSNIITTKVINSTRFTWDTPFEKYPKYFFVFEKEIKYKMDENGEFQQISLKDKGRHLAVKDGFKYIYPVKPPEKNFKTQINCHYYIPQADSNRYSTSPEGYKILKK